MLTRLLLDRAALYALAAKSLQGVGGVVSAVLVVRYFSPEVQGYYYTFANLLGLQVLLELGLSSVISIFAGHEWSKLSVSADRRPTGDVVALDRLSSLARKASAWYAVAALVLLLSLPVAGFWFFLSAEPASQVAWQYPWIALCVLAVIHFALTPMWALLLACGEIAAINAYRFVEALLRYVVLWCLMAIGALLWSPVGVAVVGLLATFGFLLRYRGFLLPLLTRKPAHEIEWRKEILPLQIRFALSWASGYLALSLFTPVVFYFLGANDAGRIGLTWAVVSALSGIAATWLLVQVPGIAIMAAKRDFGGLGASFRRVAMIAVVVFALGGLAALAGLAWIDRAYPQVAERFVPIGVLAIFLLAECLHQVSLAQATYLRAFKEEPFLGVSLLRGLIIGGGTLLLTSTLGLYGAAISYLAGVLVALFWGTSIFVSKRRQWPSLSPQ